MLYAQHDALEIDGRTARRFVVYAPTMRGSRVVGAIHSDEPVETLELPLEREAAMAWVLAHFSDLPGRELLGLVDELAAPPVMDPAKCARLEAACWRVGDAAEFLGLTDDEQREVDALFKTRIGDDESSV
jgi:hypothetical protein